MNKTSRQENKYQKLLDLEKHIVNPNLSINKNNAEKLYFKALDFNKKYSNNKHKESVYVLAAKCSDGLNWNTKNIAVIDKLLAEFPLSNNCPNYLYNKGKIYEEKLNNIEKAKIIYTDIIKKYPDSEIAKNLVDYLIFRSKTNQDQLQFLNKKD